PARPSASVASASVPGWLARTTVRSVGTVIASVRTCWLTTSYCPPPFARYDDEMVLRSGPEDAGMLLGMSRGALVPTVALVPVGLLPTAVTGRVSPVTTRGAQPPCHKTPLA